MRITMQRFTPLVISVDDAMAIQMINFVGRLATGFSFKWQPNYSDVLSFSRTKLAFSTIRAVNLRLRGTWPAWCTLKLKENASLSREIGQLSGIMFFFEKMGMEYERKKIEVPFDQKTCNRKNQV